MQAIPIIDVSRLRRSGAVRRVRQPAVERYPVAYFADPDPDALVEVLPACLRPGEAPRYPPISAAAYLRSRLDPTYNHWKASATASP
jgi:isopenicillin N synthase-like dioxygenase